MSSFNWRRVLSPPSNYMSVWVATLLLFVVSIVIAPNSLSPKSFGAMLSFAAVLMIVGAGQTLVVQQRGLDLSLPGIITLCAMVLPIVMSRYGIPFWIAVLITLGVGAVVGLANGLLVSRLGITPLIVTLSMNTILLGVMLSFTNNRPSSSAPGELVSLLSARVFGVIPVAFIFVAALIVLAALFIRWTAAGKRFVAAGSNPMVARAAGISVETHVLAAYILSGVAAALGALLLIGYVESATVTIGNEYLFTSIAAVVIGGTAFTGGRGSMIASAGGAIFLTQLVQLLLASGVPTSVRLLSQAVAIALAVAIRSLYPRVKARIQDRRAAPQLSTAEAG